MAPLSEYEDRSQTLLLLPPPPTDASLSAVRAAYGPALNKVLTEAASRATSKAACAVDIAVSCESLDGEGLQLPRRTTYDVLQKSLAGVYRLIVHICTEQQIDLDRGDRIDPRVVLVGRGHDRLPAGQARDVAYQSQGPVVTLLNLAKSTRGWTTVYSVESEIGEGFLQDFIGLRRGSPPATRLPSFDAIRVAGGTSIKIPAASPIDDHLRNSNRHFSVAVGGTFDHLHLGHRLLLTATALVLDPPASQQRIDRTLIVGITGDELLKNKKYAEVLESWDYRQQVVYQFLSNVMIFDRTQHVSIHRTSGSGPNDNSVCYSFEDGLVIKCVEIIDPFGPTITDESVSALIISGETRSGGKAVNDRRVEKGWAPLEVFEVDVLDANSEQEMGASSDFQSKLSSSEIRKRLQQKSGSLL